jgi:hypothetical protein
MANQIYPGTVNRLAFTNEFLTTPARIDEVISLIDNYRSQVPGVQVGVRIDNLGTHGGREEPIKHPLTKLLKTVDFVMTNVYPSKEDVLKGPGLAAQDVGAAYEAQKGLALAVNPSRHDWRRIHALARPTDREGIARVGVALHRYA